MKGFAAAAPLPFEILALFLFDVCHLYICLSTDLLQNYIGYYYTWAGALGKPFWALRGDPWTSLLQ